MAQVDRICMGIHVREPRWSSSAGEWSLVLNSDGVDVLNETVSYPGQDPFGTTFTISPRPTEARGLPPEGFARVYIFGTPVTGTAPFSDQVSAAVAFDTAGLNPSSVRFDIHGHDLIRPLHMLVWGLEPAGAVVPISLDADMTLEVSDDEIEGPSTIPLPLVDSGDDTTSFGEVMLYVGLAADRNAPTPQPVSFRVEDQDGALLYDSDLPDFFQLQQEHRDESYRSNPAVANAKIWRLTETSTFARKDAQGRDVVPMLRVSGPNNAMIESIVAFGVDRSQARPRMVPLVHHAPALAGTNPWVGTSTSADGRDMVLPLCAAGLRQ